MDGQNCAFISIIPEAQKSKQPTFKSVVISFGLDTNKKSKLFKNKCLLTFLKLNSHISLFQSIITHPKIKDDCGLISGVSYLKTLRTEDNMKLE